MTLKKISVVLISLIVLLTLQGCTGSGGLAGSGNSKEYNQNLERMKEVVEQAVRAGNMNVKFVSESDDGSQMTLFVGRDKYMGNDEVQQEQGEVRIIKKDAETTIVEVENPEYHFSVPSHQREDYQRIIFARIDNILEK